MPLRISALIPCYNAAAHVAEAIESALSQSLAPEEVIVVNDGSTDDSAVVVQGFGSRVRYTYRENGGICAARNTALSFAKGDVIAFLDADDVWTPDSLAVRADALEGGTDIVYGVVEPFADDAAVNQVHVEPARAARLMGSMMIRTSVFDVVGRFDESLRAGDTLDWVARAASAGVTMRELPATVMRRRVHVTNTMRGNVHTNTDYLRLLKGAIDRRRSPGTDGASRA